MSEDLVSMDDAVIDDYVAQFAATVDRAGTHWEGCYTAGPRHWPCAVAEANRQRQRAEAAERERDAAQARAETAQQLSAALVVSIERHALLTRAINAIYTIATGQEPADTVPATIRALMHEFGIEVQPADNWLQPATGALEARDWQRNNDPRIKVQP